MCRPAFDHFRRACAAWTPERVEQITGVTRDSLKAAASLMANHKKIAYHAWTGIGQSSNATQIERAVATLYALRGCFDEIGGNRIYGKQPVNKVDSLPSCRKRNRRRLSVATSARSDPRPKDA